MDESLIVDGASLSIDKQSLGIGNVGNALNYINTETKLIFCGSEDHKDNEDANKACYEEQPTGCRKRSTIVTFIDEKYCSNACEAEHSIWMSL
jgi:hypothetical protein